jgi:hypothetical protein
MEVLQKLFRAKTRKELWNYVLLCNTNGTGVFKLRGDQFVLLHNGLQESQAWKKLNAMDSPLGYSTSKWWSRYPRGKITVSPRGVSLEDAFNKLSDMIFLPVDSFSPHHTQLNENNRSVTTALDFDSSPALEEPLDNYDDKKSRKSSKKTKNTIFQLLDKDDMVVEDLALVHQKVGDVLNAKRKS